jgi:class 3 adenylate cyclase/tetratricopeptide (TPR) repeat protein
VPHNDGKAPSGAAQQEAERRQATVLFADLVGFTSFSEKSGEEAAYALMQQVAGLMTGAVEEQGGTVRNFTGDGIMALFGVPVALEDAPLRACRAALAIHDRLASAARDIAARHGIRPQLRIGINTGPVIVGKVPSGHSSTVTALGDTVNLASRLQALAKPEGVLLSDATHRLVQGLTETEPAGEHEIKGKTERQRVYRLLRLREGASRFDAALSRGLTSYIGRSRELELLVRSLDESGAGLRVVDIVGEPGIGKSRLLHEFRSRLGERRVFVLSGSCSPDGQQTAFRPLIEVVRGSFRLKIGEAPSEVIRKLEKGLAILGLTSPQNTGLILNLLVLEPPPGALQGLDGTLIGLRTRDLLLALVEARCRITPVIMLLEDLHWIDSVSEELVARLISLERALPLLILHTRRPEYQPPWHDHQALTVLRLAPLSVGDTSEIIRARLQVADLPGMLARAVADKADGNPLFAEEIASFLLERGGVRRTASGIEYDPAAVAAALPGTIQSLLTARVDQLAPEDRAILQAASAIGRRFTREVLIAVVGSRADDRLAHLQELDLIHIEDRSGEIVFKHALVQDALYGSMLSQQRSALHLKISTEIERLSHNRLMEVAEELAHHYRQTGRTDKAFRYLVMAGQKSLRVYSLDDAVKYFENALALVDANPACTDDVAFVGLLADISYVITLLLNPGKLTRLIDHYRHRIDRVGDLASKVIVLTNYSFAAGLMCQYRTALSSAEDALEIAIKLNDARGKAYARGALIWANTTLSRGDLEEMQRHAELGTRESEETDDAYLQAWIRLNAAWIFLYRGLPDRGRALALELQERGRRLGDPRAASMGLWILGWLDIVDERYEDALVHGSECIELALTPFDREIGHQIRGAAEVLRGNVATGAAMLRGHRQRALANDFTYCRVGVDPPLGVAMVLEGNFAGGVRFIETAIERNEQEGSTLGRDFARIFLAETYLEFLAPKQKPPLSVMLKNLPFLLNAALTARKKALKLLMQARDNPMFSGATYYRARIDADLGMLYKISRRPAEARAYLMQARPTAEMLSAKGLLAKIDTALAELR